MGIFDEKIQEGSEVETKGTSKKSKKIFKDSYTAKKDFVIHHNDFHLEIKEGESVDIPEKYVVNLKTEGVI